MQRKKVCRLMSIVLMMVLVFQITDTASAATVTWTSGSNSYAATVEIGNTTSKNYKITNTQVYHTQGVKTQFPKGTYTVYSVGNMKFSNQYASYLTNAANEEGVNNIYSNTQYYSNESYVAAFYASGNYCAKTTVYGYYGTYYVTQFLETGSSDIVTGEYSFAPFGCSGVLEGIYIESSWIQ